jgi:hypothetical protein
MVPESGVVTNSAGLFLTWKFRYSPCIHESRRAWSLLLRKTGLRVGMRVFLQPDPTNHYDSNAVAVSRREGTLIGHINRSDAALLSPCLLGGMEVEATVHSISKGKRKGEFCVISLDIPEEFRQTLTRQPVIHQPPGHYPPKHSDTSFYSTGYSLTIPRQPSVHLPERPVTPPVHTPPPNLTPTPQSSCFVATVISSLRSLFFSDSLLSLKQLINQCFL